MSIIAYTIPECERENLTKTLEKYAKKAVRYGSALNYSMSETFWENQNTYDAHNNFLGSRPVEVFTLSMDEDSTIKCGNYSIIAAIQHLNGGNIVNNFTERRDAEWARMAPRCEHCGTNHDRKMTFIVADENGNTKQVGSSCLKDYSGIDPRLVAMSKELCDIIERDYDAEDYYSDGNHVYEAAWSTIKMFALAAKRVAEAGYIKSSEDNSNKSWLIDHVNDELTDDEMTAGELIVRGLIALSTDEAEANGLNEARTLAMREYCKSAMFGYVAYAPIAWKRYTDKQKATEAAHESHYVGTVGEKWHGNVRNFHPIASWDNGFGGTVYLYSFTDEDGNEMIWKASKGVEAASVSVLTGTVKEHKEYRGKAQTVLTRCKVG